MASLKDEFKEVMEDINRRLKTNEYTQEEKRWIVECLLPRLSHLKAKNGLKAMWAIYSQTIKTWKFRKGKVGEVVWG